MSHLGTFQIAVFWKVVMTVIPVARCWRALHFWMTMFGCRCVVEERQAIVDFADHALVEVVRPATDTIQLTPSRTLPDITLLHSDNDDHARAIRGEGGAVGERKLEHG